MSGELVQCDGPASFQLAGLFFGAVEVAANAPMLKNNRPDGQPSDQGRPFPNGAVLGEIGRAHV